MFRRIEVVAVLLAVAMLFVPALTRVTQQLVPVVVAGQASGFSKSCDAPPDRMQGSVTFAAATVGTMADAALLDAPAPVQPAIRRPIDDALPPSVVVFRPDSLRAPPLRLS